MGEDTDQPDGSSTTTDTGNRTDANDPPDAADEPVTTGPPGGG